MSPRCPLIVMAKAPMPGYAKTRLIPALGAERSAALAGRLLVHALDQALAADIGPVDLCCAPDCHHPAFERQGSRAGHYPSHTCSLQRERVPPALSGC